MKKSILALITGLGMALAGSSLHAQTLGANYLEAGAGYVWVESSDSRTIELITTQVGANYRMIANRNYGMDLSYGGSLALDNSRDITIQQQSLFAELTGYYSLTRTIRPFVRGGVGYTWNRVSTPVFGSSKSNNWFYNIGGGVEWTIVRGLSVAPFIDYLDIPDESTDQISYGANANFWLSDAWGVGAGYRYSDLDGGSNAHHVTVSVRYRY